MNSRINRLPRIIESVDISRGFTEVPRSGLMHCNKSRECIYPSVSDRRGGLSELRFAVNSPMAPIGRSRSPDVVKSALRADLCSSVLSE